MQKNSRINQKVKDGCGGKMKVVIKILGGAKTEFELADLGLVDMNTIKLIVRETK